MPDQDAQTTKRQHQVPRFCLQRFACPVTNKVWNYDKQAGRVWPASIEDTACESHLYSVTADDGQRNTELEHVISRIEGKAAPLYDAVLAAESLSSQERYDFASFVALMFVRTNAFRRLYAELLGNMQMLKHFLIASDDSSFEFHMERFQADCGKITDEQKQQLRSDMLNPSDYVFLVDREYTLKALSYHDQLAPLVASMEWTIMEAPKGDRRFITSDNPAVQWVPPQYRHPFRGTGGFRNKHAELLLPLSPDHCFVGHRLKGAPQRLETTVEWVKQTNRIVAESAERFLYSHINRPGTLRLAKKYADSQRVIQMGGGPGPKQKAEIRIVRSISKKKQSH